MPEVDEADYKLLQLSKKALGGKNRLKVLRTLKEDSPEVPIPELDQEDRISAALTPIQEENRKLREELTKRDTLNDLKEKRNALKGRGHTDEEVSAIEKLMMEKKIGDHDTAAEFFRINSKPATPATPTWDKSARVPQEEGLKKNPAQWAREEAARALQEFAKR